VNDISFLTDKKNKLKFDKITTLVIEFSCKKNILQNIVMFVVLNILPCFLVCFFKYFGRSLITLLKKIMYFPINRANETVWLKKVYMLSKIDF
jgi:hypothetical protein